MFVIGSRIGILKVPQLAYPEIASFSNGLI